MSHDIVSYIPIQPRGDADVLTKEESVKYFQSDFDEFPDYPDPDPICTHTTYNKPKIETTLSEPITPTHGDVTEFETTQLTDDVLFNKHKPYLELYKANEEFWGLGIENETYLQFDKPYMMSRADLLSKHKDERYSVNYFKDYKPGVFKAALCEWEDGSPWHTLPVLVNSHTFQKNDRFGQPITLYKKGSPANPRFSGETLFEWMCKNDPWFAAEFERAYIFDGDTIEFVTQHFYKAKISSVIDELLNTKDEFISRLHTIFEQDEIYKDKGHIQLCRANHAFATFVTNYGNLGIFNNMTYHINITLPTLLDEHARIRYPDLFLKQHQNAIRWMQWIVPLWIAEYGSGDILAPYAILTNASQRAALSRYIGVGSYDTRTMTTGKILNQEFSAHPYHDIPYWWYHRYYEVCDYVKKDTIGCDFNFNKHINHGIELRVLDWFPEDRLPVVMRMIVLLMDHSLSYVSENPVECESWNDMVLDIMLHGRDARIPVGMIREYGNLFRIEFDTKTNTPKRVLNKIAAAVERYVECQQGVCAQKML